MAPSSNMELEKYFRDLRAELLRGMDRLDPIATLLVKELPFPKGVVPARSVAEFIKLEAQERLQGEAIAESSTNGWAIDSLVILLPFSAAIGLIPKPSQASPLYRLAFHDLGVRRADDFIVKGAILDMLHPTGGSQAGRIETTLGELLEHDMIVRELWLHPALHFWSRQTWAEKAGGSFEQYSLDIKFLVKDFPFRIDTTADIGTHLSGKFGVWEIDGANVILWANMPEIIPVMLKGGRKFDSIRSFTLNGSYYGDDEDGTMSPVAKMCRYHLRAVLNLSHNDIRIYHETTIPVVEQLVVADAGDDYTPKLERGGPAKGWTFEGSPNRDFLVIYSLCDVGPGGDYIPPSTEYAEYIDMGELALTEKENDAHYYVYSERVDSDIDSN